MIKEVSVEEIKECVNVIKTSFTTVANEFGITEINAPGFTAFSTTEDKLKKQLLEEHRPMFVLYDNDIIVGYYSLLLQDNKECELNNLCVLPSYRHKGAGEKLLKHVFETAIDLGCRKINIGIVEENITLQKWYETFGFTHIGTKKFDFFPFTCGYMEKVLDKEKKCRLV